MKEQNKRRCRLLQICSDGHVAELGSGESPGDERESRSPTRIPGVDWDINLSYYPGRNPYLRERTITEDKYPYVPSLDEVDTTTRIPVILPTTDLDAIRLPSPNANFEDGGVPTVNARGYHIQDQPNTIGIPLSERPNYNVNKIVDAADPLDEFKRQTANLDTRPVKVAERAGNLLALVDLLDYLMWAQQEGYFTDKDQAIQAIFEYADHIVPGVVAGVVAPFIALAQDGIGPAVQTAIATWNPVTPITSLIDRAYGTDLTSETSEFLTSVERNLGLPVSPDLGSIKLNEVYTNVEDVYDDITAAFRDVPDAPVYDQEYSNGVQQHEGLAQGAVDMLDNVLGLLNTVDDILDHSVSNDPAYKTLTNTLDSFTDGVGTVISTASDVIDTISSIELPNDITVGDILPIMVQEITGSSSASSAEEPETTLMEDTETFWEDTTETVEAFWDNIVSTVEDTASTVQTFVDDTISTVETFWEGTTSWIEDKASGLFGWFSKGW